MRDPARAEQRQPSMPGRLGGTPKRSQPGRPHTTGQQVASMPAGWEQATWAGQLLRPQHQGTCDRCRRTDTRLAARRDEGLICYSCHRVDPGLVEECVACGRIRMLVTRRPDNSPLCASCWTGPQHTRVGCGTFGPASRPGLDGPLCAGEAEEGEEAVRLTEELVPDLIVMGLRMPGMDGIEANAAAPFGSRRAATPAVWGADRAR